MYPSYRGNSKEAASPTVGGEVWQWVASVVEEAVEEVAAPVAVPPLELDGTGVEVGEHGETERREERDGVDEGGLGSGNGDYV